MNILNNISKKMLERELYLYGIDQFYYKMIKKKIIQNKNYIGYPQKINEKILLFVYLLNDRSKFFENGDITSFDYYKNSKKS